MSHRTVTAILSVLVRSLDRAQKRDLIRRNVALLCGIPAGKEGRPSKSLTFANAEAVVAACPESTIGAYVIVSLFTGARTEELRQLDWDHVDLIGKPDAEPPIPPHINVWRSVRRTGDTKTEKSRRSLALPDRCIAELRKQAKRQQEEPNAARAEWNPDRLVFATKAGTRMDAANVRRAFRTVAKAAGLEAAAWTTRELRHSFVSLLSDGGVPLEDISRLVGHSSTRTTERVYRKQLRPVLDHGATAMNRILGTG